MKSLRIAVFYYCVIIAPCFAQKKQWQTLHDSSNSFEIKYPSSWFILQAGNERIDIINFPPSQRAEGVVINDSGAEIIVSMSPKGISSIDAWVDHDLKEEKAISRREITNSTNTVDGCGALTELTSEEEMGPNVKIVNLNYYCNAKNKLLSVRLRYWKGEKAESLSSVAKQIAERLKVINF